MPYGISTSELLMGLRAAGEPTRLRLLALLSSGELNVKDLTRILGQSQPRISRHLKLLSEARLIERYQEGSWVYYRLSDKDGPATLARQIISAVNQNDPVISRDLDRAKAVKQERVEAAQVYFRNHAAEWDRIRALHLAEEQVETAMVDAVGQGPFELLVDLGTGTGRILELFAQCFKRGIGIDISHDMLAFARANLEKSGLNNCQVRQGDLFNLPLDDDMADAVIIHQVLHFLDEPQNALSEAARILKSGGQLLIVDFAPHELEFLRDEFAHQRLGFMNDQMKQWVSDAGLDVTRNLELKPQKKSDSDKLTVSIWLASKRSAQLKSNNSDQNKRRMESVL